MESVRKTISNSIVKRWTCRLCGRDNFSNPGQPHRCIGGYRKRFKAEAKRHGWNNCWMETSNTDIKILSKQCAKNSEKCLFVEWMIECGFVSPVSGSELERDGKTLDDVLYDFEMWLSEHGLIVEQVDR